MQHLHNASSLQQHLALPSSSSMVLEQPRRAASFDVSATQKLSPAPLRVGSFDTGRSAFSPLEVPRLLVQSPLSPLQLEPPPAATDNRLLTVPSPSDFRKSPVDNRSFSCESPKQAGTPATSVDILSTLNLNSSLLNQLSAVISRPMGMASPMMEDMKLNFGNVPKIEQMDCSGGSFETVGSGSFELMTSAQSSFDQTPASMSADVLATMPPKSVIQDDIRAGNGRFQLVRKRGRSEVWNLFGQVLDTVNSLRLPYVACYACKVLYTDTGGGTGNMTRHRCPIGASYRSSTHASSTETVEAGESNRNQRDIMGANPDAVRAQLSITMTDSGIGSSMGSTNSSLPLLTQNSGEVFQTTIGDVDREVLIDAVVKCCAVDLIDPVVFTGKGFRGLLKQMLKRSPPVEGTSPPPEVFPDIQTVRNAMQTHLRFCNDDLKNELSRTREGCRLAVETLTYMGRDYRVIHGSRISPDWKMRSNILGVFKAQETESLNEMVNICVHNYELNIKHLRVTTHNLKNDLMEKSGIKSLFDVKQKMKEILFTILSQCSQPVMDMLTIVDQLTKTLFEMDVRLPFSNQPREDIFDLHYLLAEWNDQWVQVEQIISSKCSAPLQESFKKLNPQHLRDLEHFILPFRETVEALSADLPNFHKVIPEWMALQHEFQEFQDTSDLITDLARELRKLAAQVMEQEKQTIMTEEHMIAVLLNPRLLRKLNMILKEKERNLICDKIRLECGFRNPKEPLSRGSSHDGEPHRKRRMFLNSLEDDQVTDELECYLRSQYPPNQTKDVIFFWSTIGHSQFPLLSKMARRTLCTHAIAPKTIIDHRCASVSPDQLYTFLMLRSMFDSEKDEETAMES
ncbi:hypothetical protein CAEBREN_04782 [Caenorhabditis brenneri]|uniref:BED-type domain-containing protein n=1 Tax=Caenorhabditis brenneri TaxID=135651 RepID=G0MQZ9_CAEBE|nr:hypothetical protein CAEBREN_04782 [Caenorhabditis brenneri]